jgi:hypothetical protein
MTETVHKRYRVAEEFVSPDAAEVEEMVRRHGRYLFYDGVGMRQLCCEVS